MICTVEELSRSSYSRSVLFSLFLPPPKKVMTILDLANKFPIHVLLQKKRLGVSLNNMWYCFHVMQVVSYHSCWIHSFVNSFFPHYYDNSCCCLWPYYFIHFYYCIVFHNMQFYNYLTNSFLKEIKSFYLKYSLKTMLQ